MLAVSTLRGRRLLSLGEKGKKGRGGHPWCTLIPTCGLWGAWGCRDLDGRCGGNRSNRALPCGLSGHRGFGGRDFSGPAGTWQDKVRNGGVGHLRDSFPYSDVGASVAQSPVSFCPLASQAVVSLAETGQWGKVRPHRNTMKSSEAPLRLRVCHSLTLTNPFLLTLGSNRRCSGAGAAFAMLNEMLPCPVVHKCTATWPATCLGGPSGWESADTHVRALTILGISTTPALLQMPLPGLTCPRHTKGWHQTCPLQPYGRANQLQRLPGGGTTCQTRGQALL